jgi:hypothetical protein
MTFFKISITVFPEIYSIECGIYGGIKVSAGRKKELEEAFKHWLGERHDVSDCPICLQQYESRRLLESGVF